MPGKITVDVGIKIANQREIRSALDPLKNTLSQMGENVNISDEANAQIKKLEEEIKGLESEIERLGRAKLNSSTFTKFEEDINNKIKAIQAETEVLQNSILGFINTLNSADQSSFTNWLKDLLAGVKEVADGTTDAMKQISDATSGLGKNTEFRIFNAKSVKETISDLKEAERLNSKLASGKVRASKGQLDENDIAESAQRIRRAISAYLNIYKELKKAPTSSDAFSSLSKDAAKAANNVMALTKEFEELFGAKELKGFLGSGYSKSASVGQRIDQIKEFTEANSKTIKDMLREFGTSSESSGEPIRLEFDVSQMTEDMKASLGKAIEAAQAYVQDNPIEVEIKLTTPWQKQTKTYSKAFEKMQSEIAKIQDDETRGHFENLLSQVGKGWGKEIFVELKSSINDTEADIKAMVKNLSEELEKAKFHIKPEIEFEEDVLKKAQEQLDDMMKNLKADLADSITGDETGEDGKSTDKLKELQAKLKSILTTLKSIPSEMEAASSSIPELLSGIPDKVEEVATSFRGLGEIDLGKSNVQELLEGLEKVKSSLEEIIGLTRGSNSFGHVAKEWLEADNDALKYYKGEKHVKERSAFIDKNGKVYNSYLYGRDGDVVSPYLLFERLGEDNIRGGTAVHSHGSDRIPSTTIMNYDWSSDLTPFFYEYKKGIEKQLTFALDSIEVFDTKGFFEKYQDKVGKDGHIIDFSKEGNFDEFGNIIIDSTFHRLRQAVKNRNFKTVDNADVHLDSLIEKYSDFSFNDILSSYLDEVQSKFFYEGEYRDDLDVKAIASKAREKLSTSDNVEDAIYSAMSELYSQYAKEEWFDFLASSFNSPVDEYGDPMVLWRKLLDKAGLERFNRRDIEMWQSAQESSKVFEEALGITDYRDFNKFYTIDEFLKKNPLGLEEGALSGLFSNTGIEEFSSQLEKITDSLKGLSELAQTIATLSSNGEINFGIDENSKISQNIEEITSSLKELINVYKELNGLGEFKYDTPNFTNALKEFDGFSKIEEYANRFGLDENSIVKHFFQTRPDGYDDDHGYYEKWAQNVTESLSKAGIELEEFREKSKELSTQNLELKIDKEQFTTLLSSLPEQISGIHNEFLNLVPENVGQEAIDGLIGKLDELAGKVKELSGGVGGKSALNNMLLGWNSSDQDIVRKYGLSHLLERSGVLGDDGNVHGAYAYGNDDGTSVPKKTIARMLKSGINPKAVIHSHSSDMMAMSSFSNPYIKDGAIKYANDILAAYKDFYENGIEKQITAALNEIEVFDAKGFFERYGDLDFGNDESEIYGLLDDAALDLIDNSSLSPFDLLKEYYQYQSERFNELGFEDKIKNALKENFDIEDSGKFINELKTRMNSDMPIDNAFWGALKATGTDSKKLQDKYKKLGKDNFLQLFGVNQNDFETNFPLKRIISQAFESAGINRDEFFKTYTYDEFIKENPLNLSDNGLKGLFSNTGIEEFASGLDRVTGPLSTISQLIDQLSGLSQNGINFGFDDTSSLAKNIEILVSSLNELLATYKELNGLGEPKFDVEKLASNLKTLDESKKRTKEQYKELTGADTSQQRKFIKNAKPDGEVDADYYTRWANNIIEATDRAGLSLDEFKIKQKEVQTAGQTLDIGGAQFEKLVKNSTTLKNSLNSLRKELDLSSITEPIQKLESTLLEFSEVYQKVNGVLSSSNLESEFNKIAQAAQKLNGKDLRKSQGELKEIVDLYRSYVGFGGTSDISELEGVDKKVLSSLQKKYEKTLGTEEGSKGIKEEADASGMLEQAANAAAQAKERFAAANRELLSSILASVSGIDNEGKAFASINRLFNTIGKDVDGTKAEKLFKALKEIQGIMSTPVGEGSFIKSLENLANTGDALKDLATVLKTSKKNLDKAKAAVGDGETTPYFDYSQEKINTNFEAIRESGKKIFENYGQLIGSFIRENKDGLIEMVGQIRTANNEITEMTISSASGEYWDIKRTETNTPRLLKQVQKLEQVRRAWERMNKVPDNATDQIMFDKDGVNADDWELMLSVAEDYYDQIGNLQKVTRQVRQDNNGNLLESFSFIGDKGHITMGREGEIVASSQELASLEKVKQGFDELIKSAARYNELKMKNASGSITSHEAEELARLDAKYNELIADVKRYNDEFGNNNIGQTALDEYLRASSKQIDDSIAKYIDGAEGKFARNALQKANQSTDYTPEFKAQIAEAKSMMDELNDLRNKYKPGDIWDVNDLLRVNEIFERINTTLKGLGDNSNVLAKTADVDKLIQKASKDLNDNSMSRGLRSRYQDLVDELMKIRSASGDAASDVSQIDKVTFNHIKAQFQELHAEMERTGQTGKGFFKQFTGAITSKSAQFLAQYFSLQDFIRYGRELVQMVTQINSAQTELRKVSDASHARIAENFETSAKTAQELGSTITDVINNTADWSRLGYSVDDAEKLARMTTLYQTVGDNMTQETASESLISTMKGFQLDADQAESVVDRINEVANNFAIDTAGIGEALQRSASAFNTAHTDLDKSIAIITASNTVLQDPQKVGTMWNTVAMRIRGASTE